MSWTCEECIHWNYDPAKDSPIAGGHCGLYSSACAKDILEHKLPPRRFLQREVVEDEEGLVAIVRNER